jgi:DNA end-binding protein Ku
VRKAEDYFNDIPDVKIAPDMLKLAQHIVEQKAGEFDPSEFEDHYEQALMEVIKKKQAHVPLKKNADRPAAPKNVVNLMDALRRSLADKGEKPAKSKKRPAGQGEMLMSIAGGGKGRAKEAAKPAARRKAS